MTFKAIYVTCSKCKKKKFTNQKAYDIRLAKYGTAEKMEAEWICRTCLKEVKA